MLSKEFKITRKTFPKVLAQGKTFYADHFTLRVLEKNVLLTDTETSSFSFVVSKKVTKKATERNKLKKRGYITILKLKKEIIKCSACIFFAKKNAEKLKYNDLRKEIIFLLKKAKILL